MHGSSPTLLDSGASMLTHHHNHHHPLTQPSNLPCSLLYNTVGPSVRLRPSAPRAFRDSLCHHAANVQELTLLGFENADVDESLVYLIHHRMTALRILRIWSLDLWSAAHLQSPTALGVGPTLGRLLQSHSLQVLELRRVSMGTTGAHLQALADALRHHPTLEVLTMDTQSHQLQGPPSATSLSRPGVPQTGDNVLVLDPLVQALATCPRLVVWQVYLSGYQRGRVSSACAADRGGFVTLVQQLQELSLHMVDFPSRCLPLANALGVTRTLRVLHYTHASQDRVDYCGLPWSDVLQANTSLYEVSLGLYTVPARVACWKAVAHHPTLTSVRLSKHFALAGGVPAWDRRKEEILSQISSAHNHGEGSSDASSMILAAITDALFCNPHLVDMPEAQSTVAAQALLRLNQGPRQMHLTDWSWWKFVEDYTHDLDATWLLLRLQPQSVK